MVAAGVKTARIIEGHSMVLTGPRPRDLCDSDADGFERRG